MRVLAVAIYRTNADEPVSLCEAQQLDHVGFFQRGTVAEMIRFFAALVAKRTAPGSRQSVQSDPDAAERFMCHCEHRTSGLVGCVLTDEEYPPRVCFTCIGQLLDDFEAQCGGWEAAENISWGPVEQAITDWQDPSSVDSLTRIQSSLDETKEVLHQSIDGLLERGEKLEDLVDRSAQLSAQSKVFYKQARRTNSCCNVS